MNPGQALLPRDLTSPAAVLLLLALAGLAGCSDSTPQTVRPRPVLVQEARSDNGASAGFSGEVRARFESDLAFRVNGKMITRLVDSGAEVRAGQALARLDPTDLQLAAEAATAQRSAAESEAATAHAERQRYAGLLAQKFVSQAAFDARDNAWKVAEGRLKQARAQTAVSDNQSRYGTLLADHDGVVTAVLAESGQVLAAGQPVLRLARSEEREIALAIPEGRLGEWKKGVELRVAFWALPDVDLKGRLRELSPAADAASRTYAARVSLIDPPPEVRLGMTAQVTLSAQPRTAAQETVAVPLAAVFDHGQGASVWIVKEGEASLRPVKVARYRETEALLAAGVSPGDAVVVAGTQKLTPGMKVEARPMRPPEAER